MIQWLCVFVALSITTYAVLIPEQRLVVEFFTLMQALCVTLLVGWLDSMWRNRRRIAQRLVLMFFLGYSVWILVTNTRLEYSRALAFSELAILLACVVWAIRNPAIGEGDDG